MRDMFSHSGTGKKPRSGSFKKESPLRNSGKLKTMGGKTQYISTKSKEVGSRSKKGVSSLIDMKKYKSSAHTGNYSATQNLAISKPTNISTYKDRAMKQPHIFGETSFNIHSPFVSKPIKSMLGHQPKKKASRRESAKGKKRTSSSKKTQDVFSPKNQLFNKKKLSYGGNNQPISEIFTRKSKKPVYSRNTGLGGGHSGTSGLHDNWGQFGGSRFRTHQNLNLSANIIGTGGYYQRDSKMMNRTLKKKKTGEPRMTGEYKKKSHSLPKKPKSGRNVSRNHPNAGIYSIAPKMSLSYKGKPRSKKATRDSTF